MILQFMIFSYISSRRISKRKIGTWLCWNQMILGIDFYYSLGEFYYLEKLKETIGSCSIFMVSNFVE